jgi:hypothetical protein
MRKFFSTLRRDDRGDQLVGWVLLVSFVVLVGAAAWGTLGDDIGAIIGEVQEETTAAKTKVVD